MEGCRRASPIHISAEPKCIVRFPSRPHHLGKSPSTQWTGFKTDIEDLKRTDPRLGYYIPTTRTHVPRLICLGDSSHHISAPS